MSILVKGILQIDVEAHSTVTINAYKITVLDRAIERVNIIFKNMCGYLCQAVHNVGIRGK